MSDPMRAAMANAQAVLARYVEPGGPGEADTINALLGILDSEALVRAQRASGPQPIETATHQPEVSVLLFCPEQGGWHLGEWWTLDRPRWVAVLDASLELEPTHWLPAPPNPE